MGLRSSSKEKIQKYFVGKQFLVIDPYKSCRILLKKLLAGFGVPLGGISVAVTLKEGLEMMDSLNPSYVFCYYRDDESVITPIIQKHFELQPDRTLAAFFQFVSQTDAYFGAATKRDFPIEVSIFEPLTGDKINIPFMQDLKKKFAPTPEFKSLQNIKCLYYMGKNKECFEEATNAANNFTGDLSEFLYYSGKALIKLNRNDEAITRFETSLDYQLHHYGSLKELFLHYLKKGEWEKSYQFQTGLLENHPLNPSLIPQHILVSIRMKKFAQIYDIAVLFAELPKRDKDTQKHIAAGLVMAGRFFMKVKDPELGRKILFKAADLSHGRLEIIKNVAMGLLEGKFFDDGYELIDKFSEEAENSMDYQVLELEYLERAGRHSKAMAVGINLLKKGMKTFNVYLAVIKSSVKMKRNIDVISELVDAAAKTHPDRSTEVFRILEDYKMLNK
ncbi:MAG: hypothetical protein KC493_07955 [Bacteriovoracaceae bacterium]|nr:hypothetical protein [Bacteriovoracaceae bacterium]